VGKKSEPATMKAWLIILIALLDDIAVLALVFVVLWVFKVEIPLSVVIVVGIVVGSLIFIVHRAVVPSLRRKRVTGAEGMIGMEGEVVASLKPRGIIRVGGEYWQAESLDGDIETGEEVEIVEVDRLKLEVKRRASWEQ
jgi:membrane-bound ClpP family serine protease